MTDRIRSLTVVLDNDYRDDDVQEVINAIKMIKGVLEVSEHIVNHQDYTNRTIVEHEMKRKLYDFIQNELK